MSAKKANEQNISNGKKYTAFMMDVVQSKKLSSANREEAQHLMKKSLAFLNQMFQKALAFEVVFSAGDEVQGLFKHPCAALMYDRLLRMLLFPLPIRSGIGVGEWTVRIDGGTSAEQDGSAYHDAREALSQTNPANGRSAIFCSRGDTDGYINTWLNASLTLAQRQSVYQKEIALFVELLTPLFDDRWMSLKGSKHASLTEEFVKLLMQREAYAYFSSAQKFKEETFLTLRKEAANQEPFCIGDQAFTKNSCYIPTPMKKGISGILAGITDTSRQNMDRVLRSAEIGTLRGMDMALICFVNDVMDESHVE